MLTQRDTRIVPRTNWLSSSFCYRSLPRTRAFISPKQFSRCPFPGPGSILIFGANTAATTITVDLSLVLVIKVPRCSKIGAGGWQSFWYLVSFTRVFCPHLLLANSTFRGGRGSPNLLGATESSRSFKTGGGVFQYQFNRFNRSSKYVSNHHYIL